jgi:hypothetical protein
MGEQKGQNVKKAVFFERKVLLLIQLKYNLTSYYPDVIRREVQATPDLRQAKLAMGKREAFI